MNKMPITATVEPGDPGKDGMPRDFAHVTVGGWELTIAHSQLDNGAVNIEIDGPDDSEGQMPMLPRLAVHLNDTPLFDDREIQ